MSVCVKGRKNRKTRSGLQSCVDTGIFLADKGPQTGNTRASHLLDYFRVKHMQLLTQTIWVVLGGAIGAGSRYLISAWIQSRSDSVFPFSTFLVNALGSLLIGILWQVWEQHPASGGLRLFLIVGLLGGFTTFSAFSMETFNLLRSGLIKSALLYVGASNLVCIGMAVAGYFLARWLT